MGGLRLSEWIDIAVQAVNDGDRHLDTEEDANEVWAYVQSLDELRTAMAIARSAAVGRIKHLVDRAGRPLRVDGGVVKVEPVMKNIWNGRALLDKRVLDVCTVSEAGEVVGDRDTAAAVIEMMNDIYVTASVAPRRGAVERLGFKLDDLREQQHVRDNLVLIEDNPTRRYGRK